eukprot:6075460-Alexandrium_andersonii.AAC.1
MIWTSSESEAMWKSACAGTISWGVRVWAACSDVLLHTSLRGMQDWKGGRCNTRIKMRPWTRL